MHTYTCTFELELVEIHAISEFAGQDESIFIEAKKI